jgi:hypothetical protein
MSEFTDEQLSAFLDDALAPEERAKLAVALVEDQQLAARLEGLRAADAAYIQALSSIDDRPLPDGLEAMLDAADRAGASPTAPQAANDNFTWRSIAASVALVAAFAAGGLLNPFGGSSDDAPMQMAGLASDPEVQAMLESEASGARVELASGQSAVTRLSFLGAQGDYCREFVIGDATGSTVAIACRESAQSWDVVLAAAGPAITDPGDGYTPASEGNAAFDAAVSALMAGDSADAETESALIERGWQDAP